MNYQIKANCRSFDSGYFLNNKGECEVLNYEKSTGGFIIKNISQRLDDCKFICNKKNYLKIYFKEDSDHLYNVDFDFEDANNISIFYGYQLIYIYDILKNINKENNETKNFVQDMHLCLNIISDNNLKSQLEGCSLIVYIPKTKTYHCSSCEN